MAEALIAAADEAASRLTETAEQGRAIAGGTSLVDR
jgi:CO/xanthine dehydrogenase FAD-binding subunit